MRVLHYAMVGLLVANVAVLGASISTNPFNVVWQIMYIAYAATAAGAVGLAAWLLVLLPVHDASAATKVRSRTPEPGT